MGGVMTTWRYRVGVKDGFYGIYEFYEGDGKTGWTECPIAPIGESELELIQDLRAMLRAFDEPVIGVGNE